MKPVFRRIRTAVTCQLVAGLLSHSIALATLPTGYDASLSSGVTSIVTSGSTQTITTHSHNSFGSFHDFNIGSGHSVTVVQPNSSSSFLAGVRSGNPTQIHGALSSNGTVGVINAAGVFVGNSGVVNTQGFVATTQPLDKQQYLATGDLHLGASSNGTAEVVNQGHISVGDNGFILLSAPNVRNEGTIRSQGGEVNLIAAQQVLALQTRDGLRLNLAGSALGEGFHGIVNNTGTLTASRLMDGPGGSIRLLASQVDVAGLLQANGVNGGGNIIVGGLFQGKGSEALNAQATTVHHGATLQANALTTGDGGQVIVWADGHSQVDGHFEAQGGSLSGNGGLIETSGKINLAVGEHTTVNTQANNGDTGLWLLDPENITIANSGGDITPSTIITALGSSDVVIHTNNGALSEAGDITVNSSLNYTSHNDLSLLAARDVRVNRSIQNSGNGDLNLVAGWDETTGFSPAGSAGLESGPFDINAILNNSTSYGNNGGSIFINSSSNSTAVSVGSAHGATRALGHNVSVKAGNGTGDYALLGRNSGASGSVDVRALNNVTVAASSSGGAFAQIGHRANSTLSGDINISAGGNFAINAAGQTNAHAQVGHGGFSRSGDFSGDIRVNVAGNTTLKSSGAASRSVQVGHGSPNLGSESGLRSGHIQLITAGETNLIYGGKVTVGHTTSTAGGVSNANGFIQSGTLDSSSGSTSSSFNINSTQIRDTFRPILDGGQLSLVATGGDLIVNTTFNKTTSNTLSFISTEDIHFNQRSQLSGSGGLNVVSGWDGITGLESSASFNMADVLINSSSYGNNSGSVFINKYSGSGIVSVGSQNGDTSVVGHNITLQASDNSNKDAQIGYRTTSGTVNSNIVVKANNTINLKSRRGGTAIIGHGHDNTSATLSGNIDVSAGEDIILDTANAGSNNFAIIGHGGYSLNGGSRSGNINVTAGDLIELDANGYNAPVMIGHGGLDASGSTDSGSITINAGRLSLLAGNTRSASAQIGHGGQHSSGTKSGAITVSVSGNALLEGKGTDAYAQIGHGSAKRTGSGNRSGHIDLDVGGELSIVYNGNQPAHIGHRTTSSSGLSNANVSITASSLDFANDTTDPNSFVLSHAGFRNNLITNLKGGDVTLSSSNAPISLNTDFSFNRDSTFTVQSHSDLTLNNFITNSGQGKIRLISDQGNLTLNAGLSSDSTGSAFSLAASQGNIINNEGPGLFTLNNGGRYTLYSSAPATDDRGGLNDFNRVFSTQFTDNINEGSLNGNVWFYRQAKTINRPNNVKQGVLLPARLNQRRQTPLTQGGIAPKKGVSFNSKNQKQTIQVEPLDTPNVKIEQVNGTPKIVVSDRPQETRPTVPLISEGSQQALKAMQLPKQANLIKHTAS